MGYEGTVDEIEPIRLVNPALKLTEGALVNRNAPAQERYKPKPLR